MLKLPTRLHELRARRDRGATMVEYGLIVALIAIVVAVGAFALGGGINGLFNRTATCVNANPPAAPCP